MSVGEQHNPIEVWRQDLEKDARRQTNGNAVTTRNTREILKCERASNFGADRYGDLLHFLASRILGDDQAAKKVVEDCLRTVAQKRQPFAHESDFRHWLVRVLIDEASLVAYRRSDGFKEALASARR
jgi:DNA-directed RNA polymerase specialized sigma24 family protein